MQQSQYRVAYPAVPVVGGTQGAAALLDDADDCRLEDDDDGWLDEFDTLERAVDPLVLPDIDVLPDP